jgi:transposase
MTDQLAEVVVGVDTHRDAHVAVVLSPVGVRLGQAAFPATGAGYAALLAWTGRFGRMRRAGVEGTGSYGAGLARFLHAAGIRVIEVDRPDRQTRRRRGKSDPLDAEAAARAVLAEQATGEPKTRTGPVEAIRVLRVQRTGAVKARTAALNQLHQLVVTGPTPLRARLEALTGSALAAACAQVRPGPDTSDPAQATKRALRRIGRRVRTLDAEIAEVDADLQPLVATVAPRTLQRIGAGTETVGQLLVTAGDNPDRLRNEAAFAMLTGTAPVPASSGRTDRHRLNRGGDRAANSALYHVAITRMAHDPATRAYVRRRTADGLTSKDILRCLKRLIARELYPLIRDDLAEWAPPPRHAA